MVNSLKQTALEKLSSPPSRESLLDWINWLDLECARASLESLQQQILARSIVAVGYEFVERQIFPINHPTIKAAEAYILEPTEDHFDSYFAAATDSYPFGSGDGCYAIDELGYSRCEPGSGCVSGAGSLASFAAVLGADVVMQVIAKELIPWLQGEIDPVALR
jgi:hypothetical protein